MPASKTSPVLKTAKVLIVDDHPAVREGLAIRIGSQPDLKVCGEASDSAEALQLVARANPDVAVIDIALKRGNGIDLIKRLKAREAPVRMLVWSMYSDTLYAERALRAGALGYINKENATDQIITAIRTVLEGKVYLSEPMASRLLGRMVHGEVAKVGASPVEALSDRELEVFQLIGEGLDTYQIAEKMRVSHKTVETYRARIKEKLDLGSSTELLRHAVQWLLEEK
jgi:DNA-binding NarL/FixJ family response regulator